MAMAAAGAKLRRLMGIVWWALRLLMMAQALAAAVGWLARAEMQGAAPARTPLGEALVARDAEAVGALIDAGVGLSEPTEVLAGRSGVVWCTGSALYTGATARAVQCSAAPAHLPPPFAGAPCCSTSWQHMRGWHTHHLPACLTHARTRA